MITWNTEFLQTRAASDAQSKRALIILNQPFSEGLLLRLWNSSQWQYCADGGANRLFDVLDATRRSLFLPALIKGDLDSIRSDVKDFYVFHGVPVVEDSDQDSTDLMKCISTIQDREVQEKQCEHDIILLGGLSGRLDQTIHTLSYLHKLRKTRKRVFAVTDDNVGWVLDAGEHTIQIDHSVLGPTCGLLPVGVDSSLLSTTGLKWNLSNQLSSFDGLVSTSNHLVPSEATVWIETSSPIWWTAELRSLILLFVDTYIPEFSSASRLLISDLLRTPMSQVAINVLYFAAASTATGLSHELVPIPPNLRLSSLGDLLVARHPKATALRKILDRSKWSVDAEMVDDDSVELKGGEEVGIICPVSGG